MSEPASGSRSDLILDELRKRKAEHQIIDVDEKKMKVVIFSIKGDWFAFPGHNVKEILHVTAIYPVPGTPSYIPGVINIRGDIESVLTLNSFLGFPESEHGAASRILLAENGRIRSGIFVDSIIDVVDIPVSMVDHAVELLTNSHVDSVSGKFLYRNKDIILLDIDKIFGKISP